MKFIKLTVADGNIDFDLGSDKILITPRHKVIISVDNIIAIEECASVYERDIDDKGITEVFVKNGEHVEEYIVEESIDTIYRWIELGY